MTLLDTICLERARELCDALGPAGPLVMLLLLAAAAAARERWRRFQAERAAAAEKVAAAEKIAAVKAERNQHAQRVQELEVKVASMRPPPMPPEPEPPAAIVRDGDDTD